LDVFYRTDIANVLRATSCACEGPIRLTVELLGDRSTLDDCGRLEESDQEKLLRAYRQGVRNALLSVGVAFGLEPVVPSIQRTSGASPELAELLWAEIPNKG
jgi:hypothetical protein